MSAICIRKSVLGFAAATVLIGMGNTATAAEPFLPALPPPAVRVAPRSPEYVTPPRDLYARERQMFLTDEIRKAFPRLGGNFVIVAPADNKTDAFIDIFGAGFRVDPAAGNAMNPLAGMDRCFGDYGYQRLTKFDLSVQPGVEKVVLYSTVTPDGDVKDVTAAAHQEADGFWTMKVGKLAKIRIADPSLLRGPQYGLPIAVYAR
jgi:hypothetical protein